MKNIISLLSLLIFVLSSFSVVEGATYIQAVEQANKEILEKYGTIGLEANGKYFDSSKINPSTYSKYNILAYENPTGTLRNGEYRYLGKSPKGENISNPEFPYDGDKTTDFDNDNWIVNPWKNDMVINAYKVSKTRFDDNRKEYLPHFLEGMRQQHGANFKNKSGVPWETYYHIVIPPTLYADGLAWLFHIENGVLYYIDVKLVATSKLPPPPDATTGLFDEGLGGGSGSWLSRQIQYIHTNEKAEQVTFKIYQFSGFKSVGQNSNGVFFYRYYSMPSNANLIKTVVNTFTKEKPVFVMDLKLPEPKVDAEGYYITSSETNFQKGVVVVSITEKGKFFAIDHHKEYSIDSQREGFFLSRYGINRNYIIDDSKTNYCKEVIGN